jgi:glycosyltransferase involved in cell wall biosynthesis
MVGQQVYEHFTRTTGYVSSARADTVLNGVPVEQFEHTESLRQDARTKLGIPANALVIGCVGRLVALKNHQILLDQIPALAGRHPNLQVVLAGDGPLLENLRAQVAGLGVVDRVNFLGPVNNIAALLPAFDIFALPSKTEGLSIALLEACAAGLAVVATRVGGNPEIVIDGVTGRLVEVDNAQELARALDQMLSQPAVRQKLGSAASEWVRKHASMEALQTAYDVFYNTARSA